MARMPTSRSGNIAAIRTDYARAGLDAGDLDPSPVRQIERWLEDAIAAGHPEPTAMTLATVTPSGDPAARVVLLKAIDAEGLVFFTNYGSDKGQDLAQTPRAAACFFWCLLERQIRVTGAVLQVSRQESDAYFRTRPRESQLGAWASRQSSVLADRAELEARLAEVRSRFGDAEVPCPAEWGGYRIVPETVELWQGRPSRLHDRLRYRREPAGEWRVDRLSP
jgi:pyridoxamine 5'-phosphate oxidase